MTECLIAFGGNLSNPKVTFQIALAELCVEGFDLEKKSGLWRSPAWPAGSDQPNYLNAVVMGDYDGTAQQLLGLLQSIEGKHGRVRSIPNAARTLDLDILTFGSETYDQTDLKLPHPRMLERAFVLIPASELQDKWVKYTRRLSDADIKATRYVGAW
jgi:2-amino-4-hydroxy-6-hydroxymethyldihydropteridine diphosphokinase